MFLSVLGLTKVYGETKKAEVAPAAAATTKPATAGDLAQKPVDKDAPKPEFLKFKADALDRLSEMLTLGLAQAKVAKANDYGTSTENLGTIKSPAAHGTSPIKHNGVDFATALAKFAGRDWHAKAAEGLPETRVLYWVDSQHRQHAAAINVEWWIGEEAKYAESYMRLSLDHLWLDEGKGIVKAYPIKEVSREIIYAQPTTAPSSASAPAETKQKSVKKK
jgi:hypothetical protein